MTRPASDRAREVDVALSRRLARVLDDAVTVPGIWLLWRCIG